jgi:hypothetical protein
VHDRTDLRCLGNLGQVRLKKLLAETMLEKTAIEAALQKKW